MSDRSAWQELFIYALCQVMTVIVPIALILILVIVFDDGDPGS